MTTPLCRDLAADTELFFSVVPADTARALAICRACPIRVACLEGALARPEPYGVWGGTTPAEREAILRPAPRSA